MGIIYKNGVLYHGTEQGLIDRIEALEQFVRDVSHQWQGVEYLETHTVPNNNQYIDTGIYANQNTRVVLDIQLISADRGYRMMGNQSDENAKFRFGTYQATNWLVRYNGQPDYNVAPTDNTELTNRNTVELGQGKFIVNGELRKDFGAQEFESTESILLLAINDTKLVDNAAARLYSCKIYQGEELVRDFAPVRHRFGDFVGLYDKVDEEIYLNKGTGSFKFGIDTNERW